jgi:DNA-binding response OmpR family regulator
VSSPEYRIRQRQAIHMTITKARSYDSFHKLRFGPFKLDVHNRVIGRDGAPLRAGSRARDILATLLERRGETVGKRELIARLAARCG